MLLDFINELTAYAQQQLEEQIGRARATHSNWQPNRRFVANRLAQQIFDNRTLRSRIMEQHLSWDSGMPAVVEIYRQLTESDFYNEYMNAETCTYEDDKRLWRLIFQHLLANSETLNDALDELEVVLDKANWTTDADVVISYVIKTIKRYQEDSTPDTPLLEMFDNEDELDFAKKLLETSLKGHEEYRPYSVYGPYYPGDRVGGDPGVRRYRPHGFDERIYRIGQGVLGRQELYVHQWYFDGDPA